MSALTRRWRPAPAAGAATAALALAACGGDETTTTSEETGAAGKGKGNGNTPTVAVQTQAPGGFDAQEIYADSAQSVVTVLSVFDGAGGGGLGGGAGQGSGFVVSDDGEIVTNAHVVTNGARAGGSPADLEEASEVFVEFGDRNQVPAEVVGFDPNADIALLKIDPDGFDLNPLELGDSAAIEVGEPVAALGSPFGQEQSISSGIVSATDRSIESLTAFRIDGAIQTDASINPGNSGGPLIDAEGDVIGVSQQINTTSGGNEGVGFVVPVNLVKRSIDDLREDGEAEYAYIGVESQALYPQLAERLEIDAPTGSLIATVTPDSPAAAAGLQGSDGQQIEFQGAQIDVGGDVITAVDGEELVGESDLSRLIAENRPGDEITLEIIRDGERMDVELTLEERPEELPEGSANGDEDAAPRP